MEYQILLQKTVLNFVQIGFILQRQREALKGVQASATVAGKAMFFPMIWQHNFWRTLNARVKLTLFLIRQVPPHIVLQHHHLIPIVPQTNALMPPVAWDIGIFCFLQQTTNQLTANSMLTCGMEMSTNKLDNSMPSLDVLSTLFGAKGQSLRRTQTASSLKTTAPIQRKFIRVGAIRQIAFNSGKSAGQVSRN